MAKKIYIGPQYARRLNRKLSQKDVTRKPEPGKYTNSQAWFYVGKMDAQLAPGDTDGVFTAWDEIENVATDITIEDVCLPSSAENPAPFDITKLCCIARSGATNRWVLMVDYTCSSGGG